MKKILLIITLFSLCLSAYCIRLEVVPDTVNVGVEEKYSLGYKVIPKHGHYSFDWYSDDNSICQVDGNGVIRGITPGYTKVYVTIKGKRTNAYCDVHVFENPNLYLNKYKLSMNFNTYFQLIATANYKTKFRFYSSDRRICEVDKYGILRAHLPGMCVITVETDQGDVAHCYVNVYRQHYFL